MWVSGRQPLGPSPDGRVMGNGRRKAAVRIPWRVSGTGSDQVASFADVRTRAPRRALPACPSSGFLRQSCGVSYRSLWFIRVVMLGGRVSMNQAALLDGFAFDPTSVPTVDSRKSDLLPAGRTIGIAAVIGEVQMITPCIQQLHKLRFVLDPALKLSCSEVLKTIPCCRVSLCHRLSSASALARSKPIGSALI